MKIAVACGGTGGHVFPGIAVAEELAGRGHHVTVLRTGRDVEALALKEWNGETATTGPADYSSSGVVGKLLKILGSRLLSIGVLRTLEPDVLLAMGGYASLGPVLAARRLGVPVVLHEGNAVPGRAMRFLSRFADAVAVNFESTASLLKARKLKRTGFPVRRAIAEAAGGPPHESEKFNVLVIGGSQGAEFLNELMPQVSRALASKGSSINVMHVAGLDRKDDVEAAYRDAGGAAEVFGFVNGMKDLYSRASVAVGRSGASVCAELAAFGIPSLLVPFPFAADDHQSANASYYVQSGGAKVVPQDDCTVGAVVSFIESLMSSKESVKAMREGMLACAVIDASVQLADLVEGEGR